MTVNIELPDDKAASILAAESTDVDTDPVNVAEIVAILEHEAATSERGLPVEDAFAEIRANLASRRQHQGTMVRTA